MRKHGATEKSDLFEQQTQMFSCAIIAITTKLTKKN